MSQHGHDNLMESGSPNEAITASTPSPPRRDPVEDADSTLTRKRPRLDSGSGIEGPDQHNMTACPLPSADTSTPPPADQLVEMTIRSQQPSSPTPADEPSSPSTVANDDEEQVTPGEDDTAQPVMASTESDMVCDYAAPSDSPPVIAIDDDEGDPSDNAVDGYSADYIRMVHDEENYFMQFPFAGQYPGYYMGALGQMITHFQGGTLLCASFPRIRGASLTVSYSSTAGRECSPQRHPLACWLARWADLLL
jgi:ubiquitin carboxyl-terminal hydrolase 34